MVLRAAVFLCLGSQLAYADADIQNPPPAQADEVQSLRQVVADLQRQVDELKAQFEGDWITESRAAEIRGLVQDVLADADTRASLLQGGPVAGHDAGYFFVGSDDGNFLLRIAGQLQFRFVYNMQDDSPSDDTRYGFEMRRLKIDFRGHVVDPSWQYHVEMDANRSGGSFSLGENVWIQKAFDDGFNVRFGQFKPLYLREESISSRRLMSIERSQVNTQFTAGTAQGVQLEKSSEQWRVFGAVLDGVRTSNTAWSAEDTEWAFSGRGEYLITGAWKDIEDDVGFRDGEGAMMAGAGFTYQKDEYGTGSNLPAPDFNNAEVDNLGLTADVTWKVQGASVMGAVVYRQLESDAAAIDLDQIAFVIRGGFFVSDDCELFAMYEWGDLDIDAIDDLSVVTVGVNKYFAKHSLKWQNDIGFGINEVAPQWAVDSAGWRADAAGQDGQLVFRSQFQLLF